MPSPGSVNPDRLAPGAAILASRIPETASPARQLEHAAPLFHRAVVAPSLALFTGMAGMAGFFAFVAIYANENLGPDGASSVLFARLPDRVPPFRLGAAALGLCAVGLLIASSIASVPGLVVGASVLAVGVAFTTPALFAAIFARVDASERGSASGTTSLLIDLAFGGGPMLLGLVSSLAGIPAAFPVAASLAAIGAGGSALLAFRGRPAGAAESARAD